MKRLVLVGALVCALVACGDDGTEGDVSGSDASTSAPEDGVQGEGVEGTFTFLIGDWLTGNPIEGVTLCSTVEGSECLTTDADGMASTVATITSGEVLQLRADKEGYFPFLAENVVPEEIVFSEEPVTWVMADDAIVEQLVSSLESEVDDTKGHVSVAVNTLDAEGVATALVGATVTLDLDVELGPNYLNPTEEFGSGIYAEEPGLTSGGIAQFFNVATGLATVHVEGDYTCAPTLSGLPAADGGVSITVEAGRVSYVGILCSAN